MRLLAAIRAVAQLRVRGLLADVCALAGAGLVTAGIRDIYRPAAFVFAGVVFLAFSFGTARSAK